MYKKGFSCGSSGINAEYGKVTTFTLINTESVWKAEVMALILATRTLENSTIYSDSLSAVQMVNTMKKCKKWQKGRRRITEQTEIMEITKECKRRGNIIKYVKAHTNRRDIEYILNDRADKEAKREAETEVGVHIRHMAGRKNWMKGDYRKSAELAITINDLWIGGKTKQAIYRTVLESEREKSNTKVGKLLSSKKFWQEPSYYMTKTRSNIANVYKVTQAIMAGALMTKARIRRLTGMGSDTCDKCKEDKQENTYHAIVKCPSQQESIQIMRKAVSRMIGEHPKPPRWPIILDDPTEEEEKDVELLKGILAGGIPIQWKELYERKYGKKACERACRTSALISKTIAAIWGQRIEGHRNDLVELQRRRQIKMDEWTEMILEEHYNEDWNTLGDEEQDIYSKMSLVELLDMNQMIQEEEEEGNMEKEYTTTANQQKRRRLSSKPREKWDQIPGIHLQPGETTKFKQIYLPPEVAKDIAKRYTNKYNCEHSKRGFCPLCKAGKLADHRQRSECKKRKEREWEKYKDAKKRQRMDTTDGKEDNTMRKENTMDWREIKEDGQGIEENIDTRRREHQQPKYNLKFQEDRTPIRPTNNRMKEYGQYSRPEKKFYKPLNSSKSIRKFPYAKVEHQTEETGENTMPTIGRTTQYTTAEGPTAKTRHKRPTRRGTPTPKGTTQITKEDESIEMNPNTSHKETTRVAGVKPVETKSHRTPSIAHTTVPQTTGTVGKGITNKDSSKPQTKAAPNTQATPDKTQLMNKQTGDMTNNRRETPIEITQKTQDITNDQRPPTKANKDGRNLVTTWTKNTTQRTMDENHSEDTTDTNKGTEHGIFSTNLTRLQREGKQDDTIRRCWRRNYNSNAKEIKGPP
eukprot:TRINITY_DN3216_c0_g1_i20.p1 TRINITY_DN3216_c0_g1~~TRINITY_DN3216_c0_g1_i20.p1  ORF type:complete len:865 (-),score=176.22 TRINITY_DN3216_c0_g1_i20:173-2767(-)